jgi:hypothetical protein
MELMVKCNIRSTKKAKKWFGLQNVIKLRKTVERHLFYRILKCICFRGLSKKPTTSLPTSREYSSSGRRRKL